MDLHGLGSPQVNLRCKAHQAKIFDQVLNCVGYMTGFPGNRAFSVGCEYMWKPHIHRIPRESDVRLSWL